MKGSVFKWRFALLVMSILSVAVVAPTTAFADKVATHSRPDLRVSKIVQVCPTTGKLQAHCLALRINFLHPVPRIPAGYTPFDLQSAYNLPSTSAGRGQTIAIVDAFDDPNAESDLGIYRSQFGLPSCTTTNGCFRKVDQRGGTTYPAGNADWAQEISLDLDMASAICPNCHILLVEADDDSYNNLGAAVNQAVKLNADEISNSYGGVEFKGEKSYASFYDHPGHVITASSGDSGYGTMVPAAFNTVTSVGGTTLSRANAGRGWSETVWSGTGSGCSGFVSKPSWQTDKGCANRTLNDVSADADPTTGVSVYDTYSQPGWLVFGGTSVSAPIIAGIYALSGNASRVLYGSYPYSHSADLYDITSGSNGTCDNSYLCTGEVGYNGPAGLGTPNGIGAF